MRRGRQRNEILIQQATETRTGSGAFTRGWSTYAAVWAEKIEPRGREFFAGGAQQAETTVVFRIEYTDGVTSKMRVSADGKVYDIKAVTDPTDSRREMLLACVEGVNNG